MCKGVNGIQREGLEDASANLKKFARRFAKLRQCVVSGNDQGHVWQARLRYGNSVGSGNSSTSFAQANSTSSVPAAVTN